MQALLVDGARELPLAPVTDRDARRRSQFFELQVAARLEGAQRLESDAYHARGMGAVERGDVESDAHAGEVSGCFRSPQ